MTEPRKLRVFLCHASQDKPVVRELYKRLNSEGWIDPWLDEAKLLPGQVWDIEIEKSVEAAEAVIVCLSIKAVTKEGYIQKELRTALNIALEKPEETIFLIPLRLDDCPVPRSIKSMQYIDYFPIENRAVSYERLRLSLRKRLMQLVEREREEETKNEEEKRRKREAQKIAREQRKKVREEIALKEKAEREEQKRLHLEEMKRLEDEKKKLELEKEEIANKYNEDKQRQEIEKQGRIEREEAIRKAEEEQKHRERNLLNEKQNEEKARKDAESRLQIETKKLEDLRKNVAYEKLLLTILLNGTFVGFIGFLIVLFLPSGVDSNFFIIFFLTVIGGGYVGYRLLRSLPDLGVHRAIAICAVGGGVSSLLIILSPTSVPLAGWLILSEIVAGILGGGSFAYLFLSTNLFGIIKSTVEKILRKLSRFFERLFSLLLKLLVPFVASYAFSILSWILILKQRSGLSTEITELVTSSGTEMALLNAGLFSVFYLALGFFLSRSKQESKEILKNQKSDNKESQVTRFYERISCSLFFWIRLALAVLIYFRLNKEVDSSFFYWVGVIFHPLYLIAFDFLRSFGGAQFLFVLCIQLILLLLLDLIYLSVLLIFTKNTAENSFSNVVDL